MNLPAFCIQRPAFTIVISLMLIIVGLLSFNNLNLRWVPDVKPPAVSILTSYPGASANLIEKEITTPIESALVGVSGIDTMTANNKQGRSFISVTFKLGQNMDATIEDVRTNIDRIKGKLPKDSNAPIIMKADIENIPILFIAFSDPSRSSREVSDYLAQFVIPHLETLNGVGSVLVLGDRKSAMHIWLDPAKMAGSSITADDISMQLINQNLSMPTGQIMAKDRYYNIITNNLLNSPEQINNLIVRSHNNQTTRLHEVGIAQLAAENLDSAFRFQGKSAIAIGIIPQAKANPLTVEKTVANAVKELQQTLPVGMKADIIYNQADYIRGSIVSVYEAFFEAIVFVWLVILIFLFNLRATLIPIITIPVCMIATCSIVYLLGFSINIITLMAFVLAIGLVVDDAIVMLENISRHIEDGLQPYQAALKGGREIIFPIIAMTLTLAAVYAPIAFTPGLLGVLFREFTFTLAGAVLISGIVALTLSPMMCARLLKPQQAKTQRFNFNLLAKCQAWYNNSLLFMLAKRFWVVLGLLGMALIGVYFYIALPKELAPDEDMNELDVYVSAPRDASFAYTNQNVQKLESIYQKNPDVTSFLLLILINY
jgi:multidrug efflux pump